MRRIVMFNWMTVDGYFAGPDGNLDWVVPDDEQAKAAVEGMPQGDTALLGRRAAGGWLRGLRGRCLAPPGCRGSRSLPARARRLPARRGLAPLRSNVGLRRRVGPAVPAPGRRAAGADQVAQAPRDGNQCGSLASSMTSPSTA